VTPSQRTRPESRPDALASEVLAGLLGSPKTLPPKLFYDDRGALLFEEICGLPEYYLTRTELSILQSRVGEIADLAGPGSALVEYGSGAGVKVRLLLDAFDAPTMYSPVDISRLQLARVSESLSRQYPGVKVRPVHADYTRRFELPEVPPGTRRRVGFFPGSSIGNFHPAEAAAFLSRVRQVVGPDGALVLGVDRVKDRAVLDAAYDDERGVTAAFNLNMLARINRELDGTFNLDCFRHVAFFNEEASRIEMHLESMRDQVVEVAGEGIRFEAGERIWTESSYKYDRERLEATAAAGGFRIRRLWTDASDWFWVAYLEPSTGTSSAGASSSGASAGARARGAA